MRCAVHRPLGPWIAVETECVEYSSLDRCPDATEQLAARIRGGAAGAELVQNPLRQRSQHHIGRMIDRVGGSAPGIGEQIGRGDVGISALAPTQLVEARLGCVSETVVRDGAVPVVVLAESALSGKNCAQVVVRHQARNGGRIARMSNDHLKGMQPCISEHRPPHDGGVGRQGLGKIGYSER